MLVGFEPDTAVRRRVAIAQRVWQMPRAFSLPTASVYLLLDRIVLYAARARQHTSRYLGDCKGETREQGEG